MTKCAPTENDLPKIHHSEHTNDCFSASFRNNPDDQVINHKLFRLMMQTVRILRTVFSWPNDTTSNNATVWC